MTMKIAASSLSVVAILGSSLPRAAARLRRRRNDKAKSVGGGRHHAHRSLASYENKGDIAFDYFDAQYLVDNILLDPNGLAQSRNVVASSSKCFAYFQNGHSAGKDADGTAYLVPDSGVILSSGKPEDFNGNDSDETTTSFNRLSVDEPTLSGLLSGVNDIYDPCYIQFDFKCPDETDIFTPTFNFDYVFGSEEYYEVSVLDDACLPCTL